MSAPIRFIHCADLHLGSRFVGISTEDNELGKRMRSSTFNALDEIVSKAIHEAVDFIIFSGDIFDDSNETPYTRQRFVDAVSRVGIPCYIAYGNHDYKRRWEDSIPLPPNAYVFGTEPERMFYPPKSLDSEIELIGVSYHKRITNENLALRIKGNPEIFSIGVLHCDVDGDERSPYSPCKLSDLASSDIDYWALGHKHKAEILSRDPYVVYPGNTQGRSFRETGDKGAVIVTVSNGKVVRTEFFETSQIKWKDVEVSIEKNNTVPQLIEDIKSQCNPGSFIRVVVTGQGKLDSFLRTNNEPKKTGDVVEEDETFLGMIEAQTGCKCSALEIRTSPDIDLSARAKIGDFASAVIDYGTGLESVSRNEIIDIICSVPAVSTLRSHFESLDSDELRNIVDDSMKLILAKLGECR